MIGKLGPLEIGAIVFIALLLFGPKKLGELGKGLGEGIRNFKSSMNEHNATTTPPPNPTEDKKS